MKKLLPYFYLLKRVKYAFLGALLAGLVYAAISGFGLAYILQDILPELYGEEDISNWALLLLVAKLPLVFALRSIGGYLNAVLIAYCGLKILEEIRLRVFGRLQYLQLSFFQKYNSGDLLSRSMNDTAVLQQTIIQGSNDLLIQPFTLLAAIVYLVWTALQNTGLGFVLLFLLMVPVCIMPIRYLARKLILRAKQVQKEMGVVTEYERENLTAIREVRAFNLEKEQIEGFRKLLRKFFYLQLKVTQYFKAITPSIEFITSIGLALAIFYARKTDITLEEVVPLVVALYFAYDPIKKIGVLHGQLKKGLVSLERLETILDEPIAIKDEPDAIEMEKVEGKIRFQKVGFSYGEGPVLKDVDCLLDAGKVYALVGPSGAGKSTFANLVPRFFEVSAGSIQLDGIDLRKIKLGSLREQISLVSQDPILFNDTIYNNILLSRPGASGEEIQEAARKAYAHSFIEDFENGYETLVGDRGARLSGGQKQRVTLARAFLKKAPILILDEATSALDGESERQIHDALVELVRGKTVIIIAHRFSTIQMADLIFVFDEGKIIDRGTHDQLHKSCSFYRNVYDNRLS